MILFVFASVENGVRVWRLAVESPNAVSLNLIFDQFQLPFGGEFYVVAESEVRGPFTWRNNKAHQGFAIWPIDGGRVVLEYYAPLSQSRWPRLHLSKIVHGYRDWRAASDSRSGSCNVDVACKFGQEWEAETRSVAMILTQSGTGFCSGAMLNNGAEDGRQLYLTAFHCVGYSNVSNHMLMFNYQKPDCASNATLAPRHMTAHGMHKLSQWRQSDFALLELEESIPDTYNVHLAGWTASADAPSWAMSIHHPSADLKKISLYNDSCIDACWGWCNEELDQLNHWKVNSWTVGTTEPGSSGSPLFDGETRRVVGQLHGGSASCRNPKGYDMYGQVAYSFDKASGKNETLRPHLDPRDSGMRFMDGADLNDLRNRRRFMRQDTY